MSDIYTAREATAEGKAGVGGIGHRQVNGSFVDALPPDRENSQVPKTCLLWEVTGEPNSGLATVAAAHLPTICFLADEQTRRIMREQPPAGHRD